MAKTPAQFKAEERMRYRRLGRVVVQVWVHPEDRELVHRLAKRLNKKREGPLT